MTYAKAFLFAFLAFVVATCAVAQETEQKPPAEQDSSTSSAVPQKLTRVRVGGNVAQANLIHQVQPEYPEIAKRANIEGTVVLRAVIGEDGKISDLQFISGPPLLMKSAMDAVKQWVYKRTLLNGKPAEVDTTISVVYKLNNPSKPGSDPMNPVAAQEAQQNPLTVQDSNSLFASHKTAFLIGENVARTNLIHQVEPEYPTEAKNTHVEGTVVLHALIGKDGKLLALQYISGHPLLMKSTMDAVKQWVYKPTLLNGNPIEVDTTISVVYKLDASDTPSSSKEMNSDQASSRQTSQTSATPADIPATVANGQTASVPSYPNTASGLEQMMKDMMKLEKEGKTDDLGVYAKSLTLPDADHWFKSVFGDDAGTALATASLETRKFINLIAPATLADLRKENLTEVKAVVFDDPCNSLVTPQEYSFLRLRRHQERLYDVRFSDGKKSSVWLYFAYVDKGFRYVGKLTWDQAKGYSHPATIPPTETDTGNGNSDLSKGHAPVHVGANVVAAQLIHQEAPYYPLEAKENHIQGNVVLHAIIAKDGSVHDLELKEGACALAGSALDAVQNWRYKPTLINGEPVEVDTTITVVYTLGR